MKKLKREGDDLEQLIRRHLEREAEEVDGERLARRVQETMRRKRTRHNLTMVWATAALFLLGAGVGLLLLPEEQSEQPERPLTTAINHSTDPFDAMYDLARLPADMDMNSLRDIAPMPSARSALAFDTSLSDLRRTFHEDADRMSKDLRRSVDETLDRAGLYL